MPKSRHCSFSLSLSRTHPGISQQNVYLEIAIWLKYTRTPFCLQINLCLRKLGSHKHFCYSFLYEERGQRLLVSHCRVVQFFLVLFYNQKEKGGEACSAYKNCLGRRFHVVQAGYWVKFSTSNNRDSGWPITVYDLARAQRYPIRCQSAPFYAPAGQNKAAVKWIRWNLYLIDSLHRLTTGKRWQNIADGFEQTNFCTLWTENVFRSDLDVVFWSICQSTFAVNTSS